MTLVPWAILSRIAYAANGEIESVDDINIINEKVNNALDLAGRTQQTADKILLQVNDILGISLDLWIYILLGICLFIILGMIFLLNQRAIAIIGCRNCTQYGAENAYKFGYELATSNICVISPF